MATGDFLQVLKISHADAERAVSLFQTLATDKPVVLACIPPLGFRHFSKTRYVLGGCFFPQGHRWVTLKHLFSTGCMRYRLCQKLWEWTVPNRVFIKLQLGYLESGEGLWHAKPILQKVQSVPPQNPAHWIPPGSCERLWEHPSDLWGRTVVVTSMEEGKLVAALSHPRVQYDFSKTGAASRAPFKGKGGGGEKDDLLKAFFFDSLCLQLRGPAALLEPEGGLRLVAQLGEVFGLSSLFPIVDESLSSNEIHCSLLAPTLERSCTWVLKDELPRPLKSRENLVDWLYEQDPI